MPMFSRNQTFEQPNAIVGAARRINLRRRDEVEVLRDRSASEWQHLAWRHYDEIGEIKFAFNYFASISSRVRLFAAHTDDGADSPTPVGTTSGVDRSLVVAARYEMDKLNQGRGGQPNLIRALALNILVAGECYLVGHAGNWSIRSTSELEFESDGRIRLKLSRSSRKATGNYLPDDAFVARIWRTHPQYSDDADSSLKGVANPAEELLLLSRIIKASGQSRLNAGILYVADELKFQASVDPTGDQATPDIDPFEEELIVTLTEPVDGSSPSEIVPMIIRGPAELIDKSLKHFDISRGFDETLLDRHEKTLNRVLDGIDLPKDLIQGLANVRYSNAKSISEDLLKAHIEPMMVLICEALTTTYLRPALIERGFAPEVVKRISVWYDASEVVTRPDRSEDADKGYGRMLISASTWRRSHGFSEADAPSDEELALRIALSGSVAPSTTLDFLRQVAPDLVAEAEKLAQESFGDPVKRTREEGEAGAPVVSDDPTAQPPIAPAPVEVTAPEPDAPEGELPPMEPFSLRDQQVLSLLTQFAAARKSGPSKEYKVRNRKMESALDVERRLRDSLSTHLNDLVGRALEKAGARTISRVRGDNELKSLVATVPIEEAFSIIPESRRGEFSLDDEEKLVADAIERARASFESMITEAQDQGWKALGAQVFEARKKTQADEVAKAWRWLAAKLLELTVGWLRKPKRSGNYVTMELIRTATAIAGGAELEEDVVPPMESGRAVLGSKTLAATEWELSNRYRWVHGISEDIFEPHLMLDDTVFESWEAAELVPVNPEEFPYVSHYYPGDHNGCRCDWLPEVLDPVKVNEPTKGDTSTYEDVYPKEKVSV